MIKKDVADKYGLDENAELDPHYEPDVMIGPISRAVSIPFRFFLSFGIIGVPFAFLYFIAALAIGSFVIIGGIWFCVNALMYLVFG